jgi:abhydrolase domain-containing protein 4
MISKNNNDELELSNISDSMINTSEMSLNIITNERQIATNHIKESYQLWTLWRWWFTNPIASIENEIFDRINVNHKREYVLINNGKKGIWTLSVNTHFEGTPIVLIHGFCGGIGLWAHNVKGLSSKRALYAIDLLGFGRSSRPQFSSDPVQVEQELIDSIEEWRKEMNLEKMILIGHSFGGYLSSSYSLKYSNRVEALVLADPWGFTKRNLNKQLSMVARVFLKITQLSTPLFIFRATGSFGLRLFQRFRPDFRHKFSSILGETDLIYNYLFYVNQQVPRYKLEVSLNISFFIFVFLFQVEKLLLRLYQICFVMLKIQWIIE